MENNAFRDQIMEDNEHEEMPDSFVCCVCLLVSFNCIYIWMWNTLCYVIHQASILCLNSCSYFKRVTSDAFIFLFWKKIILELSQVDWNNFKVFFFFSIWSWYRCILHLKLQLNSKLFERDVNAEKMNKSEQRFLKIFFKIIYLKNEKLKFDSKTQKSCLLMDYRLHIHEHWIF